jgi:hypothetical protein
MPVYGTQGVSSPLNDPGGRWTFTKFKDRNGSFWIFGGWAGATLSDVWRFDPDINEWTWMTGSSTFGDTGSFLATCNFDSVSHPGARAEQRSSTTDDCGIFWTFGGRGTTNNNPFSDLWIFNPDDLEWSWLAGPSASNQSGSYGTLGVPSASNLPPSRVGAVAWWGDDDRFYLYGGWEMAGGFMCDMWVFTPDSGCIVSCATAPVAAFTAPNHVCPGTCTDFFNLSVNATSFQWFFPSANPPVSTDANPASICYNTPGTYDVTLIATNATGSDTLTLSNFITVYPQPAPQGITQSGDTLFAVAGATSYQWFLNGNIISGATGYYYVATVSGDYNVVATDDNGCEVEAVIYNVIAGIPLTPDNGQLTIFPNPVGNQLAISSGQLAIEQIKICNLLGETLFVLNSESEKSSKTLIDVSHLSAGLYFVEVLSGQKRFYGRFLKQ